MRNVKGFSLLEVVVVVAIIGIISAIAYPSYTEYARKARRSDAHAGIQQVMAAQERYFAKARTYSDSADPFNNTATLTSPKGFYTISIVADEAQRQYLVTATPVAGFPQEFDANCLTLVMANNGHKSSSGDYATAGTPERCWE